MMKLDMDAQMEDVAVDKTPDKMGTCVASGNRAVNSSIGGNMMMTCGQMCGVQWSLSDDCVAVGKRVDRQTAAPG